MARSQGRYLSTRQELATEMGQCDSLFASVPGFYGVRWYHDPLGSSSSLLNGATGRADSLGDGKGTSVAIVPCGCLGGGERVADAGLCGSLSRNRSKCKSCKEQEAGQRLVDTHGTSGRSSGEEMKRTPVYDNRKKSLNKGFVSGAFGWSGLYERHLQMPPDGGGGRAGTEPVSR
jgi:hypothetical protein